MLAEVTRPEHQVVIDALIAIELKPTSGSGCLESRWKRSFTVLSREHVRWLYHHRPIAAHLHDLVIEAFVFVLAAILTAGLHDIARCFAPCSGDVTNGVCFTSDEVEERAFATPFVIETLCLETGEK